MRLLFTCLVATYGLKLRDGRKSGVDPQKKAAQGEMTLRDWLKKGKYNVLLTPQYNNQHSMFGVSEYLREQNLLHTLGGVSAGSGGTVTGAFLAGRQNFSEFAKHFPEEGWGGFGPSEPKITADYERFLDATLPQTFEELKHPLGLSLTHWHDVKSLKRFDQEKQTGFGKSSGDLHEAMLAAVTTSGGDPACPNCTFGFWPKTVEGKYPVTDGAFGDIWGSKGMEVIPHSDRLLHMLPLDYPDQMTPPTKSELPNPPSEIVSLVLVQPPIASHGYILEKMPRFVRNILNLKKSSFWNQRMYNLTYAAMPKAIDSKLEFAPGSDGMHSSTVVVDGGWGEEETFVEKLYDSVLNFQRDQFWTFYREDGRKAIEESRRGNPLHFLNLTRELRKRHTKRLQKEIASGHFRSTHSQKDNSDSVQAEKSEKSKSIWQAENA